MYKLSQFIYKHMKRKKATRCIYFSIQSLCMLFAFKSGIPKERNLLEITGKSTSSSRNQAKFAQTGSSNVT